ncbi:hypothetical protein ABHI18_005216 [Aspergillus niger]
MLPSPTALQTTKSLVHQITGEVLSYFGSNTTALQDIVTWDDKSLFVHGHRVVLLSVRALGYSAVSFYVDWALVEGERVHIRTGGVFALQEFFDAAQEAGIYVIARPGPYINAETSGGGFPGWLQRLNGRLKRTDAAYLAEVTPYIETVGKMISRAQITNGGPVILLQSLCGNETGYMQVNNSTITSIDSSCLEEEYMAYVEGLYRKVGVVIPFILTMAFRWAILHRARELVRSTYMGLTTTL